MKSVYQVAIPNPNNQLYSYYCTLTTSLKSLIGCRVLVPFGKRIVTGIVVEEASTSPSQEQLKNIIEILDEVPVFLPAILQLTKWISEYYFCSWGETLKAALPQGMSPESSVVVQVASIVSPEVLRHLSKSAPKRFELLEYIIASQSKIITIKQLQKRFGANIQYQLEALEQQQLIQCQQILGESITSKNQKAVRLSPLVLDPNCDIQSISKSLDSSSSKQSLVFSHLLLLHNNTSTGIVLLSNLLKELNVTASVVESLQKKHFVEVFDIEINRAAEQNNEEQSLHKIDEDFLLLTPEQEIAANEIQVALEKQKPKNFLLHGITGSGKTLVYFKAIRAALHLGKTVLIMVPEISLTPQLLDRFTSAFPGMITLMHSKMSDGERYDSFRQIRNKKKPIVLGVRSSIFAPLENLGLIIVDEEHEPTYKQESPAPRYNARDAAIVRGKLENAVVVLGSATPSMESYANVVYEKYSQLTLKTRADGAMLPSVQIVNMAEQHKLKKVNGLFSETLLSAIIEKLDKKEGIILFQNRRGYSPIIQCRSCGHIHHCIDCSIPLTYHKYTNLLRCHYCGFTQKAVSRCSECDADDLVELGAGTEKIAEMLLELLPKSYNVQISRMDIDTTSRKGSHRKMLHEFSTGKTDILLGTQMVAKGIDIERVTLVGVINADLSMFHPDFRATERTYQLLTQVAGRSGRHASKPGEVIVQTYSPHHQAISALVSHSPDSFFQNELEMRRLSNYPPFCRFVRIEFSHKAESDVKNYAQLFVQQLKKFENEYFEVLGPTIPTIPKLKGQFRSIVIVKNHKTLDPSGWYFRSTLQQCLTEFKSSKGSSTVRIVVDIDSYQGV